MIIIAALISLISIFYGSFGDEGDKIAIGALILQGRVLYRDIFSHHFPLAYYWAALALALGGHSILAVRISILLLDLAAMSAIMIFTRAYLGVGLAALLWSIVKIGYYGQGMLYNTFAANALLVVAILVIGLHTQIVRPRRAVWVTLGVAAAIAVLSDPLAIMPAGLAALSLLSAPRLWRGAGLSFLIAGSMIALAGLLLAATGALDDFYAEAVRFNTEVYNKYYNMRPDRLMDLIPIARTFLQINEPEHWLLPDVLNLNNIDSFSLWLLGGFAFRLGVLLATVQLLVQRQIRAAITLYVIAVSLLLRSEVFFRAQPVALYGFTLAAMAAALAIAPADSQASWQATAGRWVARASALAAALLIGLSAWHGAAILQANSGQLSYESNFGYLEKLAREIGDQACGQPVQLAYYPTETFLYFFSEEQPVGRFLFFFPWIAEVGTDETLSALRADADTPTLVVIDRDGQVWGHPNAEYMAPLLRYLDAHYYQIDDNTFRSPALEAVCERQ